MVSTKIKSDQFKRTETKGILSLCYDIRAQINEHTLLNNVMTSLRPLHTLFHDQGFVGLGFGFTPKHSLVVMVYTTVNPFFSRLLVASVT